MYNIKMGIFKAILLGVLGVSVSAYPYNDPCDASFEKIRSKKRNDRGERNNKHKPLSAKQKRWRDMERPDWVAYEDEPIEPPVVITAPASAAEYMGRDEPAITRSPTKAKSPAPAPPGGIKLLRIQITDEFKFFHPLLVPTMARDGLMVRKNMSDPNSGVSKDNLLAVKSVILTYTKTELQEIQQKLGPEGFADWLNFLHRMVEVSKGDELISQDGLYLLTSPSLLNDFARRARSVDADGKFNLSHEEVKLLSKTLWSLKDRNAVLGFIRQSAFVNNKELAQTLREYESGDKSALQKLRWFAIKEILKTQGAQGLRLSDLIDS